MLLPEDTFLPFIASSRTNVPPARGPRGFDCGFSLVELMVALAIGLALLLGLTEFFVTSSRNFSETERVSRQVENGRYARPALISEEIRHAGFYGEVGNVVNLPLGSAIAMPTSLPDPCAPDIASVSAALPLPVQGVDNASAGTCLPDYLAGTDILVVRRANTTAAPAGSAVPGGYYTQTSFCNTASPMFIVAQSGFTLTAKDCLAVQPIRQYHVYIYYIGTCSIGTGSGGACRSTDAALPTLKRADLVAGGSFLLTPLVEGIENLQIEYGIDTNGDGSPDAYTANPATVTQWAQVVSIRLHLLARNTEATPGFTDTKTYQLGFNADGTANNVTPGGSYRRHAYTELVRVQNVSQRIEATFP